MKQEQHCQRDDEKIGRQQGQQRKHTQTQMHAQLDNIIVWVIFICWCDNDLFSFQQLECFFVIE